MSAADLRLIVLARAPVPGRVKTRLVPALGPDGASQLHESLVHRTLRTAVASGVGRVELRCAPDPDHPFFQACARDHGIDLAGQGSGDLGARMQRALDEALDGGLRGILIGTDIPELVEEDLQSAATALEDGADAVLGPAEDGGYWLIGLARSAPEIFRDMPWGSDRVLAQTRSRLAGQGLHWREIATRWDVDRPEDLARLGGVREHLR